VEEAVAGEDLEHVVQERDAGLDLVAAATVEVQLQVDVGLLGAPRYRGGPLVGPRRGAAGAQCHFSPPMAASRRSTARPWASRPSSRARRTLATLGPPIVRLARSAVRG